MFSLVQQLDMGSFSMWCTPARQSPNPRRSTSLKLSDHVPSTIGLSAPSSSNPPPPIANPHPKRQHRRFSLNLWPLYAAAVSSDHMQLRLTTVISNLTLSSTGSSAAVAAIAGIITECEQAAFVSLAAPKHSGAPWWDKACATAKKLYYLQRQRFSRGQDPTLRKQLILTAKKNYWSVLNARKAIFRVQHCSQMLSQLKHDPAIFWKSIQPPRPPCPLTDLASLAQHFEEILNPPLLLLNPSLLSTPTRPPSCPQPPTPLTLFPPPSLNPPPPHPLPSPLLALGPLPAVRPLSPLSSPFLSISLSLPPSLRPPLPLSLPTPPHRSLPLLPSPHTPPNRTLHPPSLPTPSPISSPPPQHLNLAPPTSPLQQTCFFRNFTAAWIGGPARQ
ncbi:MAG: hypothetical protein WDW38_011107 [Sanguina aurantia]